MRKSSGDNFVAVYKLLKMGKFEEAIAVLQDPATGRIRREFALNRNHAWYCVADSKFRSGDVRAAVSDFKKAYEADPEDVQCLLAIGNCYDELGKPKLAERFLHKALSLKPTGRTKAAVLVNLGNSLLDQQRWADALEYFAAPSRRKDEIGTVAKKNLALARAKLNAVQR